MGQFGFFDADRRLAAITAKRMMSAGQEHLEAGYQMVVDFDLLKF
jgi:hypothetical protein